MTRFLTLIGLILHSVVWASPEVDTIGQIVRSMEEETEHVLLKFLYETQYFDKRKRVLDSALQQAVSTDCKLALILERQKVSEQYYHAKLNATSELSRVRYMKGLQIVKILYEKVLSLDHHFAGVRTMAEINKLSNPNHYPEFAKFKEMVLAKKDKRAGLDLTTLLGSNPLISVVQTLTGLVGTGLSREERERELEKVECILDFTLRMHNDLNTIYFETSFLQSSNEGIKNDIEVLFRDYSKPIGYYATLENCRAQDDWETVTQKMEDYLSKMQSASPAAQFRMQVNIEFPIERLLQFINQYNSFIDQGGKFYQKFRIILNSYENERQCETKLPAEYQKLKADIDLAINKFNVAYKPVEINGSKMKEILYGLNEFD